MTRTFLVALVVDSTTPLPEIAASLDDDLHQAGWDVESVAPWGQPVTPVVDPSQRIPPPIGLDF